MQKQTRFNFDIHRLMLTDKQVHISIVYMGLQTAIKWI